MQPEPTWYTLRNTRLEILLTTCIASKGTKDLVDMDRGSARKTKPIIQRPNSNRHGNKPHPSVIDGPEAASLSEKLDNDI